MHSDPAPASDSLCVAISGASGFIGSRLVSFLAERGHRIRRLVRDPARAGVEDILWNPVSGGIDATVLEGIDAVVHLAGENIAGGRWTAARKAAIRNSRVDGTRLLCENLGRLNRPPRVLIAASAVGFYGDRGDEVLTEGSPPGKGFLVDVVREWEAVTQAARDAGIRVVNLRMGVVFGPQGGALAQMVTVFKAGLGGRLGNGRQYVSWIAREDLVRVVEYLLLNAAVSGPVNAVSRTPVTNAELTETLGRILHRPTLLPLPSAIIRLRFGEMGQELLLASTRVLPEKLTTSGFSFEHADVEAALRAELGQTP